MALPAVVTLLNSIPEVVLAGNAVPLQLQASENLIATEGTKAKVILPWTAAANAGEYFDLLLAGETVRFTCAAVPDNSGVQFHNNAGGLTLASWVALLADDLEVNYYIARYYNVTNTGTSITIEAKENGSDYSIEFTAGTGIDCVPNETDKTGTDEEFESFYSIAVLLYCGGEFVSEILMNVDEEGNADTDIRKLLEPYVENEFTWPESDIDFAYNQANGIKSWYFLYGERWGDGEYSAMQRSDTYYVIPGGVSWMQAAKYNTDSSSFWAKMLYNLYFLSWAPLIRYVGPEEPVKLYFLNHSGATTLSVKALLYTATSSSEITVEAVTGVADKAIYEFVLSPAKVGYTGLSDQSLVKIEVWIEDETDTRISEIRTYVFDYNSYGNTRYFIFRNSLGVYEILRATGLMSRTDDYDRETGRQIVDTDYTAQEREELSIANMEQQRFSVAMGWLNQYGEADEYRNWLRDFALSKEVYYVDGTTLKPIRLTGSSFDRGKDRDTLKQFVFEFVNAFTDEYFTKEMTWNLFDESFASDFERAQ